MVRLIAEGMQTKREIQDMLLEVKALGAFPQCSLCEGAKAGVSGRLQTQYEDSQKFE